MLKPGNSHTNNYQEFFKNGQQHHSRNILDQPTYHLYFFFCTIPARKWKYRHGQHCTNKQLERENNQKLKIETLVRSVGTNLQTTINAINCIWNEKGW